MTALSQSILWQRMHEYYDEVGPSAWEDEVVPSHITSNKVLARHYSQLILAHIQDTHHHSGTQEEPFVILEIGAGHGKLGFLLLKYLEKGLSLLGLPFNTIRYVMTDITQKNIDFFRSHEALIPFVDVGVLDFACFNAITDNTLNCQVHGKPIRHGELQNPLFMINNYIFDTLPHDAFQVKKGQLFETSLEANANDNNEACHYFANQAYHFTHNPITCPYYQHPVLDNILSFYQNNLDEAAFLMPIGALKAIDNCQQFTQGALVCLVSDKGEHDLALFADISDPDISYHGSASMNVNFNAIAQYAKAKNGHAFFSDSKSSEFQVALFVFNATTPLRQTAFTFENALSAHTAHDLFCMCYYQDEASTDLKGLEQLIALLNLAEWDPSIFYYYYEILLEFLEQEELLVEQELAIRQGLEKVAEFSFRLEKTQDIPFAIGTIYYHLDSADKAIPFYLRSLETTSDDAEDTLYNLALAYQDLGDNDNALTAAKKLRALKPQYPELNTLLSELTHAANLA